MCRRCSFLGSRPEADDMMARIYFITHPDVVIDPAVPVPDWRLSDRGLARMHAALGLPWMGSIKGLWCSAERKARDAAAVLARPLNLVPTVLPTLGENDRSATGYLPRQDFERLADQFFARPDTSVRGWERAVDAQARVVEAMRHICAQGPVDRDVAVVAHGGVGALLMCHAAGAPIDRAIDQPPTNGGNYFVMDRSTGRLLQRWARIDLVSGRT